MAEVEKDQGLALFAAVSSVPRAVPGIQLVLNK